MSVISQWIRTRSNGIWADDKDVYKALRLGMRAEKVRVRDLPNVTKGVYSADRRAAGF